MAKLISDRAILCSKSSQIHGEWQTLPNLLFRSGNRWIFALTAKMSEKPPIIRRDFYQIGKKSEKSVVSTINLAKTFVDKCLEPGKTILS